MVRTDLSPVGDRLSEYANGTHGSFMALAFYALGSGLVALGLGMLVSGEVAGWARLVPIAVVLAGAGMVLSGVYPTDPTGAPTRAEQIHSVASGSASLALIGAAMAWSVLRWGRRPRPAARAGGRAGLDGPRARRRQPDPPRHGVDGLEPATRSG